jgi:hypothetical protein
MSKSKNGRPFQAAKEIHPMILQALIKVYFQSRSLVVALSASTCLFKFLSFSSFFAFIPIFVFDFHALSRQYIRACQILQCHILALELNMEVLKKVLQLLVEVLHPVGKHCII